MIIDNTQKILSILDFNNGAYIVNIISRAKYNNNVDKFIISYTIKSKYELDIVISDIINLCNNNYAQAYITINNIQGEVKYRCADIDKDMCDINECIPKMIEYIHNVSPNANVYANNTHSGVHIIVSEDFSFMPTFSLIFPKILFNTTQTLLYGCYNN